MPTMRQFLFFVLFGLSALVCWSKDSSKTIHIVADEWPGFTQSDGNGFYFELIRKIYQPLGYDIRFKILPFRRAASQINQGSADILLVEEHVSKLASNELYIAEDLRSPRYPMDNSIVTALFLKQSNISWQQIKDQQRYHLSWIRGYGYGSSLAVNHHKVTLVGNTKQGLQLLVSGRIDCYLDDLTDINTNEIIAQFDKDLIKYEVVNIRPLYPLFYNSPRGKHLLKLYDQSMEQLIQSGEIYNIYLAANLDYNYVLTLDETANYKQSSLPNSFN